jgi:hypothetical protein
MVFFIYNVSKYLNLICSLSFLSKMPNLLSKGGVGVRYFSLLVSLMSLCSPCALADDSETPLNPYELVDLDSEENVNIRTSYEAMKHLALGADAKIESMSEEIEESECSENSACP